MPRQFPSQIIHGRTSQWVSSLPSREDTLKHRRKPAPKQPRITLAPDDVSLAQTPELSPRTAKKADPSSSSPAHQSETKPEFTDEVVILQNGSGTDALSVSVRKELLDSATAQFRCTSASHIMSPQTDPQTFEMFTEWLSQPVDPRTFIPGGYSSEPWRSHALDAWLFAREVGAPVFERYALSHIITNCSLQASSYFMQIEARAPPKSAALRFSNHWVAWNIFLAQGGTNEYQELAAARLAAQANRDTNDPRIYDLEHWYNSCGEDINASCMHDPVAEADRRFRVGGWTPVLGEE